MALKRLMLLVVVVLAGFFPYQDEWVPEVSGRVPYTGWGVYMIPQERYLPCRYRLEVRPEPLIAL
jgi:hypothetical protein